MNQQSVNSEEWQKEWVWTDESALASGDGGKEAFLLHWFVQPDWSEPGTSTAWEWELSDRLWTLQGEKSSSHADYIFIKHVLSPPRWLDIFWLTCSNVIDVWGFLLDFFKKCVVTACGVVNFKQGCMKFNHLILNYKPLVAKAIFEMEILLIHRFLCLF